MGGLAAKSKAADGLQGVVNAFPHPVGAEAEIQGAERHIVKHRWHKELVIGILEYQPYFFSDLLTGLLIERHVPDRYVAALRKQKPVGVHEEGRFPGTVRSDYPDRLTVRDPDRKAVQRS